ncbi:inducible metalloproteinase inhibitor protein-like [Nymphalis io]|uniref:inducible metalloproteinase inhibitor protein-like n=1 Tax=Inachis io TaxID=171585 RepID=UPI002167AD0A|nr:inducible metalloproteinase inhibitor protein-like [Nymphalis io]
MKTFILYFSSFVFLCMCKSDLQCSGLNEILDCVGDCPPEKTCKTKNIQFNCLLNNKRCQMKCVCKKGFYRNLIGQCIASELCDKCPQANEYYSCGSACDNVCKDLHSQNQTHCPIKNIKCNEKCYCKEGYARNEEKVCVPFNECRAVNGSCEEHEEYQECKKICPPDTCVSLVARFKCDSNTPCVPGCVCKSGYLRKKINKPCMAFNLCPELANSPDLN